MHTICILIKFAISGNDEMCNRGISMLQYDLMFKNKRYDGFSMVADTNAGFEMNRKMHVFLPDNNAVHSIYVR